MLETVLAEENINIWFIGEICMQLSKQFTNEFQTIRKLHNNLAMVYRRKPTDEFFMSFKGTKYCREIRKKTKNHTNEINIFMFISFLRNIAAVFALPRCHHVISNLIYLSLL